jgi:hypothetical protein
LQVAEAAAQLNAAPEIVLAGLRSGLLNLRRSLLEQLGDA